MKKILITMMTVASLLVFSIPAFAHRNGHGHANRTSSNNDYDNKAYDNNNYDNNDYDNKAYNYGCAYSNCNIQEDHVHGKKSHSSRHNSRHNSKHNNHSKNHR